jgi:hypothetical protein
MTLHDISTLKTLIYIPCFTGLLHTTAPEHLFDALLKAFHTSTTPLVAGWHLGLLVGMPDDPTADSASTESKGGWPLTPSRALVVYKTFNQVRSAS